MAKFLVEYTDTFGGEANYSWVKRASVTMPEYDKVEPKRYDSTLMRRAKKACGLSGVRGKVYSYGDTIEFVPYGSATVMFISVCY
jgi:hypothetical protein